VSITVRVLLPGVLAEHADGGHDVRLDLAPGARVDDALAVLAGRWPALGQRLRTDAGAVRRHVNLFVDGEDVRALDHGATVLDDGSVLHVLPSVAGG
jgi:molybdopterin synthase sulfur carrier subunit